MCASNIFARNNSSSVENKKTLWFANIFDSVRFLSRLFSWFFSFYLVTCVVVVVVVVIEPFANEFRLIRLRCHFSSMHVRWQFHWPDDRSHRCRSFSPHRRSAPAMNKIESVDIIIIYFSATFYWFISFLSIYTQREFLKDFIGFIGQLFIINFLWEK